MHSGIIASMPTVAPTAEILGIIPQLVGDRGSFPDKTEIPITILGQNPKTKKIISLPTPIKVNELDQILDGYNTEKRRFLVDGFSQGFTLGYSGPREYSFANNSESTIKNSDLVDRKLQKEIELGRIAGPFQHAPFSNFRISPLAIIPKIVPGEYRFIHNLSAPLGNSINSHIPHELASVNYKKMQHAVDIIKKIGEGNFNGKN